MTFEVDISHEVINGERVIEEFEDVEDVINPHDEVSPRTVLRFADGSEKVVDHGSIVRVTSSDDEEDQ